LYIFWLYFSLHGRVSSPSAFFNVLTLTATYLGLRYWLLNFTFGIHIASDGFGNNYLTGEASNLPELYSTTSLVVLALLAGAVAIKRCHDYGSHGIEALAATATVIVMGAGQQIVALIPPHLIAALPADLLQAWQWLMEHQYFAWVGCMSVIVRILFRPGNPGPNRYGKPPGTEDESSSPADPAGSDSPRT
jgi:uncharacterized membrane protein YhaH (DUF805 family)